jgi:hypothetical protein
MKRKLEEESYCCIKKTTNNENPITNNQNFVIEIDDDDDDDDLEMLYSRYPSTEYEISAIDKIIKDEENNNNNNSKPKTYKVTINIREALARPLSTINIS